MLLVIGANGFVGRHIVRHFEASGRRVCSASHLPGADVLFDLNNPAALAGQLHGFDIGSAVICSGIADIERCAREREATWNFNVTRMRDLIAVLRGMQIGILFCSSDMVFSGHRGGCCERDPPDPASEYGRQKRAIEMFLLSEGEPHAILRMSKLYSIEPGDGSMIHQTIGALKAGSNIRAATDQIIVPTAVGDVARTVEVIVDRGLAGVFHVSAQTRYSRYDLVRDVARAMAVEADIVACSIDDFPFLEKRPKTLWLDGAQTRAITGVQSIELADVLGDILAGAAALAERPDR